METKLAPNGTATTAPNSAPQQGQQPSNGQEQSTNPNTVEPSVNGSLTKPTSVIADTMNRALDQRQEQQLYSSTWSGVLHVLTTVIPSPARNDRQRVQELIQTLELLAEDQKKKNKAFDPREPIFFNQLVAVIGADRAKDLVDKTQKLASEGNDPAGAAKLMRDIAELITASTLGAKYGVDATTVEKELRQQLPSSPRKGAEAAREVISRVSFEPQKGK
jgi:hypothetical protein